MKEQVLNNVKDQSNGTVELLVDPLNSFFLDPPIWRFLGDAIAPPVFHLTKHLTLSEGSAVRKALAAESSFRDLGEEEEAKSTVI